MSKSIRLRITYTDWERLQQPGIQYALIGSIGDPPDYITIAHVMSAPHPPNSSYPPTLPNPFMLANHATTEGLGLLQKSDAANAQTTFTQFQADLQHTNIALANLVLTPQPTGFYGTTAQPAPQKIRGIDIIGICPSGSAFQRIPAPQKQLSTQLRQRLARQTAILQPVHQQQLHDTTIAIVGCGGNGSWVALLLALAGVGRLILIDGDCVEPHNRNRLAAARLRDAKNHIPKVIVLQRELHHRSLGTKVIICAEMLGTPASFRALAKADLIVGCSDSEGCRLLLNRFAIQHIVPYVDAGVGFVGHDGIQGAGQIRTVLPGGACLECYNGINRQNAAQELAQHFESDALFASVYGQQTPPVGSLVTLNVAIATETVASVLAIFTGIRSIHPYLYYDAATPAIHSIQVTRSANCPACGSGAGAGRGDGGMAHDSNRRHIPSAPLIRPI